MGGISGVLDGLWVVGWDGMEEGVNLGTWVPTFLPTEICGIKREEREREGKEWEEGGEEGISFVIRHLSWLS
jgi:hypothetical protein